MKASYWIVRAKRSKVNHAVLLADPNGITMCRIKIKSFMVSSARASVTCWRCRQAIVDAVG